MILSGLCMHSNTYDLKYPLLFNRSSRPFICHKTDSILPVFPSENSKYPDSLLEQVTPRGCWASVAVDNERLTGHGPENPTVYPSLNGRVGLDKLQRSNPTSMILWLYWLHAYHPSFACLNNIMTCRPSHSRIVVLSFLKASTGSQKRPWFRKWSLHTLSVLSWNTMQLIL